MVCRSRRFRSADPVAGERRRRVVEKMVESEPTATGWRRTAVAGCVIGLCPWQTVVLSDVVGVCDRQFLGLVARQLYRPTDLGRYDALVAALVQQRVDRLYPIPAYNGNDK